MANLDLSTFKAWLKRDWEQALCLLVFLCSVFTIYLGVKQIKQWFHSPHRQPSRPWRIPKIFEEDAFAFLRPEELEHITIQEDHAFLLKPPGQTGSVMFPQIGPIGEPKESEPIPVPELTAAIRVKIIPPRPLAETDPKFAEPEALPPPEDLPPNVLEREDLAIEKMPEPAKVYHLKGTIYKTLTRKRLALFAYNEPTDELLDPGLMDPGGDMFGGDPFGGDPFGGDSFARDQFLSDLLGEGGGGHMPLGGAPPLEPAGITVFVEVGEALGGLTIVKISRMKVTLEDENGNQVEVAMGGKIEVQ